MQDIAASLGISRTTVWKVFSGQDNVSDALREKILLRAKELNYKIPTTAAVSEHPAALDTQLPTNIALAVCRPESSLFWMSIIHQIAKSCPFITSTLSIPIFRRKSTKIISFRPPLQTDRFPG